MGGNVDEESLGRTDDPVRMYLREMGSVELLSREGEIAIAKRIEAGRDMMIGGLCESPQTFKAIIAWHEAVKEGRMLLRDVIDLEATNSADAPDVPPPDANEEFEEGEEGEGLGLSLSALEEKLKPEALLAFEAIEGAYSRLQKLQNKRMEAYTAGEDLQARSEKTYEKTRAELVALVQKVHLHNNRIEELVEQLKHLNRKLTALEGQVLRMAEASKVKREEFLQNWRGSELDPAWFERLAKQTHKSWKTFVARSRDDVESVRGADGDHRQRHQPADRRVPPGLRHRLARRARHDPGEEGDDRGQPAAGDLDRQEIHQSRAAIPRPDPGRQYRPDEGGR